MLVRSSLQPCSPWQLSFPSAVGWTIVLALLFPLDVRGADKEIPPPEEVVIPTVDGVLLHATFFPGIHEKDSVPIILLHGFKRDRHDFDGLAAYLQGQGHAVIAPDLRGHGESTDVRHQGTRNEKIEAGSLRQDDFLAMIECDVEGVKTFLKQKNNEGELNIDKLCVVGAEMGALIAAGFARRDWDWAPLATGKQGQDVKALVLISPEANFKGLHMADAISDPAVRSDIAILLIAGKKRSASSQEINRLYDSFKRFHPDSEKKDLFRVLPVTPLQGAKLLSEPSLKVNQAIGEFVALLVKRQFPWAERKTPLD